MDRQAGVRAHPGPPRRHPRDRGRRASPRATRFADDLEADLARPDRAGRRPSRRSSGERSVGFRIDDEDLEDLKTVRDAVDYVVAKLLERSRPAVGGSPRELNERLGHPVDDPDVLGLRIVHRSWCAEHAGWSSNERLEFLGDYGKAGLAVTDSDLCRRTYPTSPRALPGARGPRPDGRPPSLEVAIELRLRRGPCCWSKREERILPGRRRSRAEDPCVPDALEAGQRASFHHQEPGYSGQMDCSGTAAPRGGGSPEVPVLGPSGQDHKSDPGPWRIAAHRVRLPTASHYDGLQPRTPDLTYCQGSLCHGSVGSTARWQRGQGFGRKMFSRPSRSRACDECGRSRRTAVRCQAAADRCGSRRR